MIINLKKISTFIIIAITMLITTACGQVASDKGIMLGEKAIEIGEQYVDGDISYDDAYEQLEDIVDSLTYARDYSYDEQQEDKKKKADHFIYYAVSSLRTCIFLDDGISADAETFEKVKEALKKLKEEVK